MQTLKLVARLSYYFWLAMLIEIMALAVSASATLHLSGYSLEAVQTGSMVPTFHIGDALIAKRANANAIRVGDVISYVTGQLPRQTISHRVVYRNPPAASLVTKGDHLAQTDSAIGNGAVRAKVVAVVPHLGYVMDASRTKLGLVVLGSCLLAMAAAEFYRLGQQQHRCRYRL